MIKRFFLYNVLNLIGAISFAQDLNIPKISGDAPGFYALLISSQSYKNPGFPPLNRPNQDAKDFKDVLIGHYSFEPNNIRMLPDRSRDEILDTLESMAERLTEKDNLLIFFAGHGTYKTGRTPSDLDGYLVPVTGEKGRFHTYISAQDLTNPLNGCKAKHILIITDACYSGTLVRREISDAPRDISVMYSRMSRQLMASGNLEPVPDNSSFIYYLIKNLRENQERYLSSDELFRRLREAAINNTGGLTLPICAPIYNIGDENGQFIFMRSDVIVNRPAQTVVPVNSAPSVPVVHANLGEAKRLMQTGDIIGAKKNVDEILGIMEYDRDGEAWYLKSKIYNEIAANDRLRLQFPDAREQAFDAIQKYTELDDRQLASLQADRYAPINDIYRGYFSAGVGTIMPVNSMQHLSNLKIRFKPLGLCKAKAGSG